MRATLTRALLLFACACGGSDAAPSSQFSLEGHVVDDSTGHAIEHATVNFDSDTLDHADSGTDHDGHFEFDVSVRDGVDFGLISATHPDYEDTAARTIYFDGTDHVLTLRMRAKTPTK
ncbi:MAG TPA: hypothetical protein VGI70_01100 [Polyangiales bacterium]|jgi:hypothetical protein